MTMMPTCRSCGAFLMPGWDRCKICGSDPTVARTVPTGQKPAQLTKPTRPAEVLKPPKTTKTPRTPKTGPSSLPAGLAVLVVAVAALGWFFLLEDRTDEATIGAGSTETSLPDPSATGSPAVETTVPVTPSTVNPSAIATSEDFAAVIADAGIRAYPEVLAESWSCVGRVSIDALGGADELNARGVTPADFSGDSSGIVATPAGSIDAVTAAFGTCSVDVRSMVLSRVAAENPLAGASCLATGVDGTLIEQSVAASLVGVPNATAPDSALGQHLEGLAANCLNAA